MRITLHKTLRQVAFHKAAKRDPSQETDQGEHHREQLMALLDANPPPKRRWRFSISSNTSSRNYSRRNARSLKCAQGYSNDDIAKKLGVARSQNSPGY